MKKIGFAHSPGPSEEYLRANQDFDNERNDDPRIVEGPDPAGEYYHIQLPFEVREKYFLSCDNDCHYYVIPLSKRDLWLEWTELPDDNEESWTPPEWARPVGGCITLVTFENPVIKE